jgi:hypothetical protein
VARIPCGRSIFVRCYSGMDASGCDTTPVSVTTTDGTLQCAHGSRRRRSKRRCSGIRAVSKGRACTMDGKFYSSTLNNRLNCTRPTSRPRHKTNLEPIIAPECASRSNFKDSSLTCKFLPLKYESSIVPPSDADCWYSYSSKD